MLSLEGMAGIRHGSGSELKAGRHTCAGGQVARALLGRVPAGAVCQAEASAAAPSRVGGVCAGVRARGPRGPRAPAAYRERRERHLLLSQPWAPGLRESRAGEGGGSGLVFPKGGRV